MSNLTREALLAAIEKMRGPVVLRACGVTEPHVVHPAARGETFCANCGAPVHVTT